MKKNNRLLLNIVTVIEVAWFIFIIFHILLTGKIDLWNFPSNVPPLFFLVIPLLLLTCEILWRRRKWSLLMIVLALFLGATQTDFNLFRMNNVELSQDEYAEVKVFNWNVCLWDQDKDRDHFYEFLKKQKADIYILQEYLHIEPTFTEPSPEEVKRRKMIPICTFIPGFQYIYEPIDDLQALEEAFPGYQIAIDSQYVLLSRFPIKTSQMDFSEQYAVTDIDVGGRLIRFFNVHILLHVEPVMPFTPYFFEMIDRRFKARSIGFQNLKEEIKNTKMDYFVCGDFNSTKAMGVMGDFMKDHIDAIKYSDELLPLTFKYFGLKLWRVDYAFVNKKNTNIMIRSYKSIDNEGLSDHYPFSLVLGVKK